MIKNIVFDLGNVLIKYDPMEFILKNIKSENRKQFYDIIFQGEEWKKLDRGVLSYDEAVEFFSQKIPEERENIVKLFENDVQDVLFPIEKNIELVKKLKEKGYKLYILSNFHEKAFYKMKEKCEFEKIFHGYIVSFENHLLKPEKEIYEVLLKRFELVPEETLFIDDIKENIDGAIGVGIQGKQLKNYNELEKILKSLKLF